MTEEEKQQIAQEILKNAHIDQFVMGDGYQNCQVANITPEAYNSTMHNNEHDPSLVQKLLPYFNAEPLYVTKFLDAITGADPTIITTLVNQWMADGKILSELCGKPLWQILNDYGLYSPTYQTWNNQIVKPAK